jgi:hypothetical protein
MKVSRILMILIVTAIHGRAAAEDHVYSEKGITWRQNTKAVVEVSGLWRGCYPPGRTFDEFVGNVVKRNFADDAIHINNFVVEYADDGTRQMINIDPLPEDASMALISAVIPALQHLLREGRTIHGKTRACGVAGRVLVLEAVR